LESPELPPVIRHCTATANLAVAANTSPTFNVTVTNSAPCPFRISGNLTAMTWPATRPRTRSPRTGLGCQSVRELPCESHRQLQRHFPLQPQRAVDSDKRLQHAGFDGQQRGLRKPQSSLCRNHIDGQLLGHKPRRSILSRLSHTHSDHARLLQHLSGGLLHTTPIIVRERRSANKSASPFPPPWPPEATLFTWSWIMTRLPAKPPATTPRKHPLAP